MLYAPVVELVDTRDLLSASAYRVGATPTLRPKNPSAEMPYRFKSGPGYQKMPLLLEDKYESKHFGHRCIIG